jgi:uncharacterized protein (DUF1778 family)
MSTKILSETKTKVLLTLTLQQKEIITQMAKAKGLSLSSFLRLKALENVEQLPSTKPDNLLKIKQYLSKKVNIPKQFKQYQNFKDFLKAKYLP